MRVCKPSVANCGNNIDVSPLLTEFLNRPHFIFNIFLYELRVSYQLSRKNLFMCETSGNAGLLTSPVAVFVSYKISDTNF